MPFMSFTTQQAHADGRHTDAETYFAALCPDCGASAPVIAEMTSWLTSNDYTTDGQATTVIVQIKRLYPGGSAAFKVDLYHATRALLPSS